ncbi:hypothetical protein DL93DRAFT_2164113 [Clavulina sp. PMI_390]|nr:hypothetical protein DL93DRAFT_2164113 [Clavulina sp. PMI_390]
MPGKAPVTNNDVAALKAQGDAAYRACKLVEARESYTQALELQEIPTIRSNLAATQFEMGDYESSIKNSEKLVSQLEDSDHDKTLLLLRMKNDTRRCRALLLLKRWDSAIMTLEPLLKLASEISDLETSRSTLEELLKQAMRSRQLDSLSAGEAQEYIQKLPRYRPSKHPELEYYSIGNDSPASLLGSPRSDPESIDTSDYERLRIKIPQGSVSGAAPWSFDALMIGSGDARHLYSSLFDIAEQLQAEPESRQPPGPSVNRPENIKFHFTLADIHPAAICRNLVMLLALDETMVFLRSGTDQRAGRERLEDMWTLMHFTLSRPVKDGVLAYSRTLNNSPSAPSYEEMISANDRAYYEAYPGTFREREIFFTLKILWPPSRLLDRESSRLHDFFSREISKSEMDDRSEIPSQEDLRTIQEEIMATWLPNVTFIAQGWPPGQSHMDVFKMMTDFFDPPYMDQYRAGAASSFHDHSASFWLGLNSSWMTVFKVADKIRAAAITKSRDGPALFDRIHLNNVPDYTSVSVSSYGSMCYPYFSYKGDGPNAEGIELDRYLYTHAGILHRELELVFGFKRELSLDYMGRYMAFSRKLHADNSARVTKGRLSRIIYDVFFKTVMPIKWEKMDNLTIRQPLNIQNWFKFLFFLAKQGYPLHWLSEVVDGMLGGSISTAARPPTSLPHLIPSNLETETAEGIKALSLTPFVHELRTFAALWAPIFPFSILSPHLPPATELRTCQLKIKGVHETYFLPTAATYCLKFFRDIVTGFLTDQIDLLSQRDTSGAVFISTIHMQHDSNTITFLLTRAALIQLQQEGWHVGLWSCIEGHFVATSIASTAIKELGDVGQWEFATTKSE